MAYGQPKPGRFHHISITVEDCVALFSDSKRFLIFILGKYPVDFQILGKSPCKSTWNLGPLSRTKGLGRHPLHGSEGNLVEVMAAKLFFLDGLQKMLDVLNKVTLVYIRGCLPS